jgi:chorismate mutase
VSALSDEEKIEVLRKEIDSIDERILRLLMERVSLSKGIGKVKVKLNMPVLDEGREAAIYKRVEERAEQLGMNPIGSATVFREIIRMCRNAQKDVK